MKTRSRRLIPAVKKGFGDPAVLRQHMARKFAEMLEGMITVEGQVNGGSICTVTLPITGRVQGNLVQARAASTNAP